MYLIKIGPTAIGGPYFQPNPCTPPLPFITIRIVKVFCLTKKNKMKKLMFIFLLVMPVCKGAVDPYTRWNQAVQAIPNWQQAQDLNLVDQQIEVIPANPDTPNLRSLLLARNRIAAIPDNFNPPMLTTLGLAHNLIEAIPYDLELHVLRVLDLSYNNIQEVNPERFFQQFPMLMYLNLSGNAQFDLRNIQDLRKAAAKVNRHITIVVKDIRPEGQDIKGD